MPKGEEPGVDVWVEELLADPITKESCRLDHFPTVDGICDARVWLRNSAGFRDWWSGQDIYESWEDGGYASLSEYEAEIAYDRCIYEHFELQGPILDVGGGVGTVREFLREDVEFVSIDPFIDAPTRVPALKQEAYSCLKRPLNFIGAMAEFLPFRSGVFATVHMRSMLDHLQLPDLALLEARRVLKPDGRLVVGVSIEGAPYGSSDFDLRRQAKELARRVLGGVGVQRYRDHHTDHHTWHPTLEGLRDLLTSNGFAPGDPFWQPHWNGRVVYLEGRPI